MLSKSNEKIFVGFDDSAQAVKYYFKDTQKLLTSRNYQFLKSTPTDLSSTKNITEPDHEIEEESDKILGPSTEQIRSLWPRKRPADAISDESLRRTRRKIMDYKWLDNPFSNTDNDDDSMIAIHLMINNETYSTACSNMLISLQEAKKSPNWPEWKKAIQDELDQLWDMGIWKLEKKPLDAIPIANKWLFVKKTNISGQIEKYKARLVIKGCIQRPRFDFHETYSSVVRIETVRIIITMVPQFNLKIQQMDVKEVFLNEILEGRLIDLYLQHITTSLKTFKERDYSWSLTYDGDIIMYTSRKKTSTRQHSKHAIWDLLLHLCARVTLILTYYRPSAYHLRRVPYLLPISAFMCTTSPSIPDSTARTPPSVTILVLS